MFSGPEKTFPGILTEVSVYSGLVIRIMAGLGWQVASVTKKHGWREGRAERNGEPSLDTL